MADGNIVYQGIANRAPRYFESIGFPIGKFTNATDMFMRFISIEYPKKDYDVAKLEHLVTCYQKKCEPNVIRHMNDSSLLEFKPRNDNFSEPSFKIQL